LVKIVADNFVSVSGRRVTLKSEDWIVRIGEGKTPALVGETFPSLVTVAGETVTRASIDC